MTSVTCDAPDAWAGREARPQCCMEHRFSLMRPSIQEEPFARVFP